MSESIGERWESFAASFGLNFLNFWNAKAKIFPVLFAIIAALAVLFFLYPSEITFILMMVCLTTTIILGITGMVVMPKVAEDITMATKYITRSLIVIVIVVIILLGLLYMTLPVLFPTPAPAQIDAQAIDMRMGKVIMENYVIEGPVDYEGKQATHITAENVKVWDLVQAKGEAVITAPYAELTDLEIYCTYVKGASTTLGISAGTAWTGNEAPPLILKLLGNPITMEDVVMHALYQNAVVTTFGEMAVASVDTTASQAPSAQSEAPVLLPTLETDSVKITAESMTMTLDVGLLNMLGGLLGSMQIDANDVAMTGATIEMPMEYGNGTQSIYIDIGEGTIGKTTMMITTLNAVGLILQHPLTMGIGLLGLPVTLTNVEIIAESMLAENLTISGLNLRTSDEAATYGANVFTIHMDHLSADQQNIIGVGYSQEIDMPYMILEVSKLDTQGMTLTASDSGTSLQIESELQSMDKAVVWAVAISSTDARFATQEITESPHTMSILSPMEMNDVTIFAIYFNGKDVSMGGMIEDVK